VSGLVGIYTDPRHVILYTGDGEVRQEFSVVSRRPATSHVRSAGSRLATHPH
jgi:hypothetical protein